MPFKLAGTIRYYSFDCFERENIFHAVLTRHKGVSPAPWDSLNLCGTNGDDRSRVLENRRLVFESFQMKRESVFDVWQVHGDHVICTELPRPLDAPHQMADAIVTSNKDVILLMLFADCVPILLYDPETKVIGIAHAGWKGTIMRIAGKTIQQMRENYGSKPENILAGIGPSICPDHFVVGIDVIEKIRQAFGSAAENFLQYVNGKARYDLWASNRWILEQAGVKKIQIAGVCTACHTEDWFSHRIEHGTTGRFGVLMGLRNQS